MFNTLVEKVATAVGSSWVFFLAVLSVVVWLVCGFLFGFTDSVLLIGNTVMSLVSYILIFLIQGSQNRVQLSQDQDTRAIQLKLDEIIKSTDKADDALIGIEKEVVQ
jgi:low affinity Fe/Cu permease